MAKKYYSRSEKEKLAKKLAAVVAVFVIVCTATVVIGHIVDNQKMNDYTKERETCYNNSSLKGEHENGNHEKICTVLSSVS